MHAKHHGLRNRIGLSKCMVLTLDRYFAACHDSYVRLADDEKCGFMSPEMQYWCKLNFMFGGLDVLTIHHSEKLVLLVIL
jgi:hypothetical protein